MFKFERKDGSVIDPFHPAFKDEWLGWAIAAAIGAAAGLGSFIWMVVLPSIK